MSARRVSVPRRPVGVGEARRGSGGSGGSVRVLAHGWDGDVAEDPRDAEVRAIMGGQLRLALRTVALVAVVSAGPPILLSQVQSTGVWLVVSMAVQPVWVLLALHQLRRAERVERDVIS